MVEAGAAAALITLLEAALRAVTIQQTMRTLPNNPRTFNGSHVHPHNSNKKNLETTRERSAIEFRLQKYSANI
jgi:hypothetical protein